MSHIDGPATFTGRHRANVRKQIEAEAQILAADGPTLQDILAAVRKLRQMDVTAFQPRIEYLNHEEYEERVKAYEQLGGITAKPASPTCFNCADLDAGHTPGCRKCDVTPYSGWRKA